MKPKWPRFCRYKSRTAARHATELASKAELINFRFQNGLWTFHLRQTGDFKVPTQFLAFLRQQVTEADYLGLQYLYKAGYDSKAAVSFLQKIQLLRIHRFAVDFQCRPANRRSHQGDPEEYRINATSPHSECREHSRIRFS
jgi:predicted Zn-dependent protease